MTLSGFSLWELMTVLALCMLMIGCGVYTHRLGSALWVALQTEGLVAHWQTLQWRALYEQKKQTFWCEKYQLFEGVCYGVVEGVKGPPSLPQHIVHDPIHFVNKKIVFYPEGVVQAGTLYFTDHYKGCSYAITSSVGMIPLFRRYVYRDGWVLCA